VFSFLGRHVNVGGLIPDAGWTQLACLLQCTHYVPVDVVPLLVCPIGELAARYQPDIHTLFDDTKQAVYDELIQFPYISWRLRTYVRILKHIAGCKRELASWLKWALDCHIPLVCAIQQTQITCVVDIYRFKLDPRQQSSYPCHPHNMCKIDMVSIWRQSDTCMYSVEWLLGLVCPSKRSSRQLVKILTLMVKTEPTSAAALFFVNAFRQFSLGNGHNENGSTNFEYRQSVYRWDIHHVLKLCNKYIKTHLVDFVLYEIVLDAIRSSIVAEDYIGRCVDLKQLCMLTHTICDRHLRPCLAYNLPPQRITKALIAQHTATRIKQTQPHASVVHYMQMRADANKRMSRVAVVEMEMPQRDIIHQLSIVDGMIVGPRELISVSTIAWFRSFFDNSAEYARQQTWLVSLPARIARMQHRAIATRLCGKRQLARVAFCYHCAALRVNPVGYKPKKKTDFMRLFGANNVMVCDGCDREVVYIDLVGKVLTARISHHNPGEFIRTTLCTTCVSLCCIDESGTSYNNGTITCVNCTKKQTTTRVLCYKGCIVDKSREPDYEFYARDADGLIKSYAHCHRHPVPSKRVSVPSLRLL